MTQIQGTNTDKFQGVRDTFQKTFDEGKNVGASVCVIHNGEVVVDIWGGHRDLEKTTPWTEDTLVNVWSTTKTMTFLVGLMLHSRGELDFDAPVAKYWPEFAANGKADIQVRNLFSHTAGLSGWEAPLKGEDLANWELSTSALAEQAPWWSDRTKSGYHAVSQGHLIGEVVRRITGTTIGQFLKSEVSDVLGADFFIGLPESEEDRVSIVIPPPSIDFGEIDPTSIAVRTLTRPPLDATMPSHRWWRAAEIPAAGGHGNAKSVATIQEIIANNGHAQGHRFFNEKSGDLIFQSQAHGIDQVLGSEINFGMGYGLASSVMPIGPRSCYWGGYGGSVIIMDQDAKLTVAFMMNKMEGAALISGDTRGADISFAAAMAAFS